MHESYIINRLILHEYRINLYITYNMFISHRKYEDLLQSLILLFFHYITLHMWEFIATMTLHACWHFMFFGSIKVELCYHSDKFN